MQIREYSLPQGWYPRDPKEVSWAISGYLDPESSDLGKAKACIVPHAGWYYSGKLAVLGISSLEKDLDIIAVIGGHLPAEYPTLFAMEDGVRTPLGVIEIDNDFRFTLMKEMNEMGYSTATDRYKDNTVEVLLPMVKYFFPKACILWLRAPAGSDSCITGKFLSKTAKKLGKKIGVIGSTDLTHYGQSYGFMPHGSGEAAMRWMREVNDAAFIKAVESGTTDDVIARAENDKSACSAGAVLSVMGFAAAAGAGQARLLGYATSADADKLKIIPDSFVGYAAFGFF